MVPKGQTIVFKGRVISWRMYSKVFPSMSDISGTDKCEFDWNRLRINVIATFYYCYSDTDTATVNYRPLNSNETCE
jgi:hypothetical protein